jgi:hypothetical protein
LSVVVTVIEKPTLAVYAVEATPPGEPSIFLNLTVSLLDLPWFKSVTVIVVDPLVIAKGLGPSNLATAGSILAGLEFLRPYGS